MTSPGKPTKPPLRLCHFTMVPWEGNSSYKEPKNDGWQDSNGWRLISEVTSWKMSITNRWTKATGSQGVHILGLMVKSADSYGILIREQNHWFICWTGRHTHHKYANWFLVNRKLRFLNGILYIPFDSYAYTFRPSWRDLVDYLYG